MEFIFQAKNQEGAFINGKIEAPTEDQAVTILHRKDLIILQLELAAKPLFSKDLLQLFNRPNRKDVVIFTRQLATLIDADVPLVEGLHSLVIQIEKDSFKKVIASLATSIEGGATLSIALSEHSDVFGQFYVSLVRAGEVSGKLQSTLLYMADYLERSSALTSKIRGALSYPAFIVVAIVIVAILMMTMVLPQLLGLLEESGTQNLPVTTRILIAVSGFINSYLWLVIIILVIIPVLISVYIKSPGGRTRFDTLKIRVPRFGKLIQNFYIARLGETLSTLIKARVPILDSLGITSDVVGNTVYRNILLEAKTNVQGGGSVSEVFQKHDVFPSLVSSMLAIGEKTGRTDYMLDNITKFYRAETENAVQNITALIEPVLILFLGLAVGILVSAVLLPIYNVVGNI